MVIRAAGLSADPAPVAGAVDLPAVRRVALWGLLAAKLLAGWGVRWDIEWHVAIGRDSFWIPPHLMTYTGVALVVLLSFGVLAWETARGRPGPETIRILGLHGTRGFHVAAWGIAITVAAAPIDDAWHRLFGIDVTLWSPPHLLGFLGGAVNSLGCLRIAREVYPADHRGRLAALVVAAAWLYGTFQTTLEPALLIAYRHGGVRFYAYPILAALLLPLALVSAARLSDHRLAPLLVAAAIAVSGALGGQVARAGFAWLKPPPLADAAIALSPDSPIALARAIARRTASAPGAPPGMLPLLGLVPAAVMALADARRRPIGATLAYAAARFAVSGWMLGRSPAFGPMAPGAAETATALALALAAGALGGWTARRLADTLARPGSRAERAIAS